MVDFEVESEELQASMWRCPFVAKINKKNLWKPEGLWIVLACTLTHINVNSLHQLSILLARIVVGYKTDYDCHHV